MIYNACVVRNEMVKEEECKECKNTYCGHAGELTTKERLVMKGILYSEEEINNGKSM